MRIRKRQRSLNWRERLLKSPAAIPGFFFEEWHGVFHWGVTVSRIQIFHWVFSASGQFAEFAHNKNFL